MAPFYTDLLEVAFATQPLSTSPVFTNITPWLTPEPVVVTHGRPDEFSDVAPSTLAFTLDNSDGRFTRGLATGPYAPNVKNGRRVRYSRVRSGVTYRRFDGHIDKWPLTWSAGSTSYAEARVTATDRLGFLLGRRGELRSMLEEEILRDAPVAYYPLGEPQGATSAASVTASVQSPLLVRQQGAGGVLEFGQGTGPGTDELSAPVWTPATTTTGPYLEAALSDPVPSGSGRWLEVWFATSNTAIVSRVMAVLSDGAGDSMMLNLNEFGEVEGAGSRAGGTETFAVAWVTDANDMHIHQAVLTESISGSTVTVRLYGDGVERASTTFSSTALPAGRYVSAGWWKSNPSGYGIWNGTLAHVAAGSGALSAARVLAHYNAGANGLAGERTDQRIGRIADWVGIPAADRNLDTGDSTVGRQATSGKQPREAFREVETTEDAPLFVAMPDGKLTFHKRSRRYNVTPAVTLNASQKHLAEPPEWPGDDFGLTNDMTVERAGGAPARATDQASVDEHGLARDTKTIVSDTDAAAWGLASWRVAVYGTPKDRLPQVTVDLATLELLAPTLVPALLAAEISTKLRVAGLPAQAPAPQVDVFVEGWTETVTTPAAGGLGTWKLAFNTSPDLPPVWDLGVDGFSELGSTTYLGQ
jgi:hypothetical protein